MKGNLSGPLTDEQVQEWWRNRNRKALSKIGLRDPLNWIVGSCVLMAAIIVWQVWFS